MSAITWIVLGAVAASVLWMFVLAWCLNVIRVQRKIIATHDTTIRLYRETRNDSDRQVRELLGQNERLARQLIDQAAATTTPSIAVPQSFFHARRES